MSNNENYDSINYEFYIPFSDYDERVIPQIQSGGIKGGIQGVTPPPKNPGAYIPPPGGGHHQQGNNMKPPPPPPTNGNGPFPGNGPFNPMVVPPIGPPNYVPSKKDAGVQYLVATGPTAKAVSPNSVSFCLYQMTYIWETNGRSYWAYIMYVDRVSLSGFRWMGRMWAYFGVDLRRIESFVCYRNGDDDILTSYNRDSERNSIENNKIEYYVDQTREVYSTTIAEINIPESKEDFIVETVGMVDDKPVQTKIPCTYVRTTSFRINLEISFNDDVKDDIRESLLRCADEVSQEINELLIGLKTRGKNKYLTPLENFHSILKVLTEKLTDFYDLFNHKLQKLPYYKEISKVVTFKIIREKITSKWTRL